MKTVIIVLWTLLILTLTGCQQSYTIKNGRIDLSRENTLYYAVKVNDILCGYSEVQVESAEKNGIKLIKLDDHTFVMLSLLGSDFNTEVHSINHLDSNTGQYDYQMNHIRQGPLDFTVEISNAIDSVIVFSTMNNDTSIIAMDENVVLRSSLYLPYLIDDFADSTIIERLYEIFEPRDSQIQQTRMRRLEDSEIKLAGAVFEVLVLEEMNQVNGVKMTWWIDKSSGYVLKVLSPRAETYLADAGIKDEIDHGNMNDLILKKANLAIADINAISYMKVKARMEPSGLIVKQENLNTPGQKFTGTVNENLIDGVFEVQINHYKGENAPPFPSDFSDVDSVAEFLKATDIIESQDSILVRKAKELTEGSENIWEAAIKLSQWVADSIGYAIPGGMTARNTYDIRKGECGAHSILLAAFCRAVGIPARMVWGCMYVPNRGGSFGQHGWTEVYMGEAGWIPVDATVREVDYVDSGHIRIGHFKSLSIALNAEEFEILDYRLGEKVNAEKSEYNDSYCRYTGTYLGKERMYVIEQDGQMAINIPNKVILGLNDPDEAGRWYAKLSPNVFVTFNMDGDGYAEEMILHEIIPLPKKKDAVKTDDIPDEMLPCIGLYDFQQANAEFTVFYKNGSLVIHNPLENRDIGLQHPDEHGHWKDEFNKNEIFFDKDKNGNVIRMNIESVNRFRKEG